MRRRAFFATLLGWAVFLLLTGLTAVPAQAADPVAPYVELTPGTGQLVPGGDPLTVDALFHNTLDTDITDSFIVSVGIRLAPPAPPLTPPQVRVEWFDAAASVWRAVELTPGDTALSGFLSTDAGLPSVGSLPAGGTALIGLRIALAAQVPAANTVQFVAQGLVQPSPLIDPVALMDGKASYAVVAQQTATGSASPSVGPGAGAGASASPTVSASPSDSPSVSAAPSTAVPSGDPSLSAVPAPAAPRALSGGTGGEQLANSGSTALVAAGVAALVVAAGAALATTRRRRHGRY